MIYIGTMFIIKKLGFILVIFSGREDRIRTCDPMVPNHVHYQTVLLLENKLIISQILSFANKKCTTPIKM